MTSKNGEEHDRLTSHQWRVITIFNIYFFLGPGINIVRNLSYRQLQVLAGAMQPMTYKMRAGSRDVCISLLSELGQRATILTVLFLGEVPP